MQTEKINDLEKTLMDKNAQLKRSEEIIQSVSCLFDSFTPVNQRVYIDKYSEH